ncbi:hypothetical protein AAG570_001575 [Ranatra chinensis]|uniref:Uncharacterized protein n=1 Tax=Ranatra chinensis TaxID=642074 RepID=A0ABD0Y9Q4_9HEMI
MASKRRNMFNQNNKQETTVTLSCQHAATSSGGGVTSLPGGNIVIGLTSVGAAPETTQVPGGPIKGIAAGRGPPVAMEMLTVALYFLALSAASADPSGEKTLVNKNVDFVLDFMKRGMVIEKYWGFPLGSFSGEEYSIRGGELFNASTISRTGDVFMYTPRVDDMTIAGDFALSQLWLTVEEATFRGRTFRGELRTAGANSASVRYTMYHKSKRNCRTDWELLRIAPFEKVTLSAPGEPELNGEDLTAFVNEKVLPELNAYFATPKFLDAMSHDFNFCFPFPGT